MPKITVDHILGFLDGRIAQIEEEPLGFVDSFDRGRLQAYNDLKGYILIEGLDPE